jgi:alpha-1,2-mannosyltransferase
MAVSDLNLSRLDATPAERLYVNFTVAAVVLTIVCGSAYALTSSPPFDAGGYLIGRDFINTWLGGRAALDGDPAQWFDHDAYNSLLRELFGPSFPAHNWSYPPHLLLFTWPLGLLPYFTALAAWHVAGLALFLLAAANGERRVDRLLFLAVAPAAIVNLLIGQNGFFLAAILIGALVQLDRRPILAGILFGLLSIKPHLGLLVPLMLALTGRWRAIAAAAATVAVLAAAAAAVFGPQAWIDYVKIAVPLHRHVIEHDTGLFVAMMPTAFMNVRVLGLGSQLAWAVQGVVSLAAVAAVVWTYWRPRDPVLSTALLVTASFLVTPYAYNYDMVVFGWLIMLLRDRPDGTMLDHRLALAVWTLPLTTFLGVAGIPGSALVLAAFAARLVIRLAKADPRWSPRADTLAVGAR